MSKKEFLGLLQIQLMNTSRRKAITRMSTDVFNVAHVKARPDEIYSVMEVVKFNVS
jgi:hypothetical protein